MINVHQVMNFCILHWCWWCSYVAQMMKTAPKSIIFMNLTPRSVVSLKKPMNWQKTLDLHLVINICVLHLYWWRSYLSQAAHLYIVKVLQSLLLYKYPHWKLGKIVHIYECYMVFECHLYLIITNVLKHKKISLQSIWWVLKRTRDWDWGVRCMGNWD